MKALSRRIESQYEPVLFAVMKRHVDDAMPILAAIKAVEDLRGTYWKLIDEKKKSLVGQEDMDDEARKRYRQRLLDPEFATLFAQAGATKSAVASRRRRRRSLWCRSKAPRAT